LPDPGVVHQRLVVVADEPGQLGAYRRERPLFPRRHSSDYRRAGPRYRPHVASGHDRKLVPRPPAFASRHVGRVRRVGVLTAWPAAGWLWQRAARDRLVATTTR